ncbi:unnamed protein product [Didymodactylos carnosus]|uniref:Cadherin domain-containing protein n=1 Tax=Didymodactylos carnosus TaxID=1234261 RepID=A0A814CQC8_9BILA|nr:unnamed protein product [Didymodactylos carnosus]CAF3720605.1 unnamed protein product [Didymodactylos carnosus]
MVTLTITPGQSQELCKLQYLPADQILSMLESDKAGDLIATLNIFGTPDQIETYLDYNSTVVKTNGTDYFSLNFTKLYLRYPLNYESWVSNGYPNPFRIIVSCIIKANQSINNLDFQMELIDVNDNAPTFNQSIYSVYLLETAVVNSIVYSQISAYDLDFGIITYYLRNDSQYSSYFTLVSSTNASLILLKPLDYNQMISQFNLTIVAQDNGVPSLSSQATIYIQLIDVDNLNPIFQSNSYNLNISIDTLVNSVVTPNEGTISAYDQDIGINATIIYFLATNTYFAINKSTGILTLQNSFNFTTQFDLLLTAQQENNANRSVTILLHVNVYEINIYPPRFVNTPYSLDGYTTNSKDKIPSFNGTVNDADINPRLQYSTTCSSSSLLLQVTKINLRQFQVQTENPTDLPVCSPCLCQFIVTDGLYFDQTVITVTIYILPTFSMSSYLFSADYPLNTTSIGTVQAIIDGRCQVQYSIVNIENSSITNQFFTISSSGSLRYSSTTFPTTDVYQMRVIAYQLCLNSSRTTTSSVDITITVKNFPTASTQSPVTTTTKTDQSTLYAIIASVIGFIFIVLASMIIIIYYKIQRARRRVPPFFTQKPRSQAQGLFFKSKTPLDEQQTSPYTLDVRDDSSSGTPRIFHHSSSNDENGHQRLLSGRYKVNEPPLLPSSYSSHYHTTRASTLEDLLSSYDNRSSTPESNSSVETSTIAHRPGSFRTTLSIREPDFNFGNDHQQHQISSPTILGTINEDTGLNQQNNQHHRIHRPLRPTEDSMDIISESHESSISAGTQSAQAVILHRDVNDYLTVFV